MLIKVQKSNEETAFVIYENVSNVTYETQPQQPPQAARENPDGSYSDWFWYSGNSGLVNGRLNKISFVDKNNMSMTLWFDGEAYICTDTGHTVQKIKPIYHLAQSKTENYQTA